MLFQSRVIECLKNNKRFPLLRSNGGKAVYHETDFTPIESSGLYFSLLPLLWLKTLLENYLTLQQEGGAVADQPKALLLREKVNKTQEIPDTPRTGQSLKSLKPNASMMCRDQNPKHLRCNNHKVESRLKHSREPHYLKVVGSNPAGCRAFFLLSFFLFQLSFTSGVSLK